MHVVHTNAKVMQGLSVLDETPHVTVTFDDINIHVMGQYHNIKPNVTFHIFEEDGTLKLQLSREDIIALARERGTREAK